MHFLIVIFCVIVATYGHRKNMYKYGRCPEIPAINNSNYVNFTGKWCICEQHAISLPGFNSCTTISLEPKRSNNQSILLDITYSGVSENGQIVIVHGEVLYKNSRDVKAKYSVEGIQIKKNYLIDIFDYNYAMIGSCMEEGSYHIFEMWTAARDCNSCANAQNKFQLMFRILGVKINFTPIDHSNCP